MYRFLVAIHFLACAARATGSALTPVVADQTEGTFRENFGPFFQQDQCVRFCAVRNADGNRDSVRYVDLSWSTNGLSITVDRLANYTELISSSAGAINGERVDNFFQDCRINLDLNCGRSATEKAPTGAIKSKRGEDNWLLDERSVTFAKLAEERSLSGPTSWRFEVRPGSSERIVLLDVTGNVSSVVVRIPYGAAGVDSPLAISLTRSAAGVKFYASDAPPGEWWVKLVGAGNSRYHFIVRASGQSGAADFQEDVTILQTGNDSRWKKSLDGTPRKPGNVETPENKGNDESESVAENSTGYGGKHSDVTFDLRLANNERSMKDGSNNGKIKNLEGNANGNGNDETLRNIQDNEKNPDVIEKAGKLRARSSLASRDIADGDKTPETNGTSALANLELSGDEIGRYADQESARRRRMLIELNGNSNLLAEPGTFHKIVFDVTNGCVLPVRYAFRARSSGFGINGIYPQSTWVYPGQLAHVTVTVVVPFNTAPDARSTVTLSVLGTEIKDKSVLVYAQSPMSRITDDAKPTAEYSFNNNCAGKTDKTRCSKSWWSADITVQDYDSGLKRVISSQNDIQPQTEFISGTRDPVKFYYSATCCDTSVTITAVDVFNNRYARTIDVTVWNNLSEAEIAAITVGVLLILLLIVSIALITVSCVRRKKSHDLPYSQRYGSRPQPERTSF